MMRKSLVCFLILFAATGAIAEPKKSVAVMLFKNDTGSKSLQYLSSAFAESISTVISQNKDITVVERNQLSTVLKEIELQQTGLFDESTAVKAGKLAKANFLIIGSYSGAADNLAVSIKAVDVASGKSIDGRFIQAPLSTVFDKIGQAALSMTGIIAGKNIGFITVTTSPENCEIWLDGIMIGRSPLIEYKVVEGDHTLMTIQRGYIEHEQDIRIKSGKKDNYSISMIPKAKSNRLAAGIAFSGFIPLPYNKDFGPGFMGAAFFSSILGNHTLTGEFAYAFSDESYEFDTVFGKLKPKSTYTYTQFNLIYRFTPYANFQTVMPYLGLVAGIGSYSQYQTVNDKDINKIDDTTFHLAPVAGIMLFPHGMISIFFEARLYYLATGKVQRNEFYIQSPGLNGVLSRTVEVRLIPAVISAGIQYNF